MALAAGWLAIWAGMVAPAGAQPAIDWHAKCVDEIKEFWKTNPPPASVEIGDEKIRVIALPLEERIRGGGTNKCMARIIASFRMVGATSVFFSAKDSTTVDYNKEQCERNVKRSIRSNNRPIFYLSLVLRCVPNGQNAAKIKEWLDVDKAAAGRKYRNVDFRLFELIFETSYLCRDQKEFAAYYACFANAISEADLSRQAPVSVAQADVGAAAVAQPQDVPAPAPAQNLRTDDEAVQPRDGSNDDAGSDAVPPPQKTLVTAPPPSPLPADEAARAPPPTEAGPVAGGDNERPVSSRSLLTDYSILLTIVTTCLALVLLAWKLAWRRRSSPVNGSTIEPEQAIARPNELLAAQSATRLEYKPAEAPPIVPTGEAPAGTETVQDLKSRMAAMESQISDFKSAIALRDRDIGTKTGENRTLLSQLSNLETTFHEQRLAMETKARALEDQAAALRAQLFREQGERTALRNEFSIREANLARERDDLGAKCAELGRQRDEFGRRCDELTREQENLKRHWQELATERDDLIKQRDNLASRLEFVNSQAERLKSGLPLFLSPADLGNPLSEFWVSSSKWDPQAHSRLEGVLRSYKIANDDASGPDGKLLELVNDVGVHLYALMDANGFDESRKREAAANWQAALNKDGGRRFIISVPWPGTPIDPLEMVRKDQRCPSERINCVRSWVVKDKDGRVARRAIVE